MKKYLIKVLTVAVAAGAMFFAVPSTGQAATITSVSVNVNGNVFCGSLTGVVCAGSRIWDLGATGVNLSTPGTSLVLTQGQLSQTSYNFDTSDLAGAASPTITINGQLFTDSTNVLNDKNLNSNSDQHNESVDWTSAGTTGGISLWVAYADNAHLKTGTNNCADSNQTCTPEGPWLASSTNTFLGNAIAGGCAVSSVINPSTSCYDAGALRIETPVSTPEPSVLLTLGVGLIGVALLGRKRAKNNINI